MGICGSSAPDISIVPNKYTLDVDNDCQKKCLNPKQSDISIKVDLTDGIVKKTDAQENNKSNKKSDKMLFNIHTNNDKKEEKKNEKKNVNNKGKINEEFNFKKTNQINNNNENNENK